MKIGIVDHPQRFMRHIRPQRSNSAASLAQFNHEFINMILPRSLALHHFQKHSNRTVMKMWLIFLEHEYKHHQMVFFTTKCHPHTQYHFIKACREQRGTVF
jgi:hypothetical protein